MVIIDFLLYLLVLVVGVFFITYVANVFLTIKQLKKKTKIVMLIASLCFSLLWYLILGFESNFIYLIFTLVIIFGMFEEKIKYKVFTLLIIMIGSGVFEILLKILTAIGYNIAYKVPVGFMYKLDQIHISLFQLCAVLCFHVLSKKQKVPSKVSIRNLKNATLYILMAITFLGFVFLYNVSEFFYSIGDVQATLTTSFLLFSLLMGFILVVFLLLSIQQNLKQQVLSGNNTLLESHISSQLNHYNQLEKSLIETRKIKHDMLNHMISLNYLLEKSDTTEAKSYIREIEGRIRAIANTIETGNNIVDAILNEKIQIAQEFDIEIVFKGALENNHFIEIVDLCTIVSNSLDNAIEAVHELPVEASRCISIKTSLTKGYWLYKIENDSIPVYIDNNKNIVTTKLDQSWHGFGLINIREAVNKYGGELNLTYQENKFMLEIAIKLDDKH